MSLKLAILCLCCVSLSIQSIVPIGLAKQSGSCAGKCDAGLDGTPGACQCNTSCQDFGDCCADYADSCLSCKDRCDIGYNNKFPCQCNDQCGDFGNCCSDYNDNCDGGSSGGSVTDEQLKAFSEDIYLADVNSCGGLETMDPQGSTSNCGPDNSPLPMISSFDNSIFTIPTVAAFRALFDNYDPDVKVEEDHTAEEQAEESAFLDAVLATEVMTKTRAFLNDTGVFTGDSAAFKAKLTEMWFKPYDRDGTSATVLGSSGFEHVFIGESKGGDVSGFHNWIHFLEEEDKGNINYHGYIELATFSNGVEGNTNVYTWNGDDKCIGGFFVGTSPELDLAVKTVCFLARAEKTCVMTYVGVPFNIVTYKMNGNQVATAYPDFSP